MNVEIIPIIDHQEYTVNGHKVYRDQYNNWACRHDLSNTELNAFRNYEKAVINNKAFKKHTKSIYKPKGHKVS
ncbi:hypothetical protein SGQ83_01265 [Flavobacterium sp. Fl-318]|jgi:hypothetical protein|uniref:Uncharacterized protein n=1 Tax=Flavobacterium cupriresistens TaxID=2893885 RepID=A0ABU4R937_9FLAO|nr:MULTISPECIES: hypothetical protein [unclassified Flavobacterium]MDX6187965.1 hypothetical protein [Flavobacterium sp. Fl-318]UFH42115.1 hypothetical protein LNP23_20185 [Flavobacterium sp. F-323]